MKLQEMSKEEIEVLSYTDLTNLILKEEHKTMNTPTIFRKICSLLDYTDEDYASKIGDYYTSLTLDKRFILLDSGDWDLTSNHKIKIELDDIDDEDEYEVVDESEEETDEVEETIDDIDNVDDIDDLDNDDDMDDLEIVPEEELEDN